MPAGRTGVAISGYTAPQAVERAAHNGTTYSRVASILAEHIGREASTGRSTRGRWGSAVSSQPAGLRYAVTVAEPVFQRALHSADHGAALSGSHVVEHHAPSGSAVLPFHCPVRFGELKVVQRQAVVSYQRVRFERRVGPAGSVRVELATLVRGAFNEQSRDGGPDLPTTAQGRLIQEAPIPRRGREQCNVVET